MQKVLFLFLVALSIGFTACSSDSDTASAEKAMEDTEEVDQATGGAISSAQEALRKAADEMEKLKGNEKVEVVDHRELKALLPEKVLGMERIEYSSEKSGVAGFKISTAKASYAGEDRVVDIAIIDGAGVGLMQMGMATWMNTEIDRENSDGYERTTTIDGMKAYEEYNSKHREGQIVVYAKERFLVSIEGEDVDADDLRDILEDLDLDDLPDMR